MELSSLFPYLPSPEYLDVMYGVDVTGVFSTGR